MTMKSSIAYQERTAHFQSVVPAFLPYLNIHVAKWLFTSGSLRSVCTELNVNEAKGCLLKISNGIDVGECQIIRLSREAKEGQSRNQNVGF